MRTKLIRALLFICTGSLGCTSRGSDDAGAELALSTGSLEPRAGSLALIRLEHLAHPEATPEQVIANAKVARYTGLDASSVLKLLGVDVRDGEGCTVLSRLDDLPLAPEARVELLTVGNIAVRVGERSVALTPRLFPDLATTASGWFYAGNLDLPAAGAPLDEYVLSAPGLQGVGRFEVSIAAPGEVLGLELGGVSSERGPVLARGTDTELSWEPEDLRNRIEIEVHAAGAVLSCGARDDGQFALPQGKLSLLEPDAQASLVVRRVSVVVTDMQGIETAYVRLASTRTLSLQLQ